MLSDCYRFFLHAFVGVLGDRVFRVEAVGDGAAFRLVPALLLPGPMVGGTGRPSAPTALLLLLHHSFEVTDFIADVGTVHWLCICAGVVSSSFCKTPTHFIAQCIDQDD